MDQNLSNAPTESMLAKALLCSAQRLYSSSLNPHQFDKPWAVRMRNPQVGDLVAELTGYRHPDVVRVGKLVSITDEPYPYEDWDEAYEGRPVPTREIYTLALLTGNTFRWEDCMFVSLPTTGYDPL